MRTAYETGGDKYNTQYDGYWDEYGHEFVYARMARLLDQGGS